MPRLMDKQALKTVMSDVDAAENVWYENVVCDTRGPIPFLARVGIV